MPDANPGADTRHTRNLAVLLAGAVLCAFLWSWLTFSGPFRGLVDLQLRLFGDYSEPATAFVLGVVVALLAYLVADLLERALPAAPAAAANVVIAAVLVAVTFGVLAQAWRLWNTAAQMPGLQDPIRVVDLSKLDGAAPPPGHVQLIGVPAHARTVTLDFHYRAKGYSEAYVPMAGRGQGDASGDVRIVAVSRGANERDAANRIPSDPKGMLVADGIDTRTIYDLRRRGLPVADHPWVLFWPGDDIATDTSIEAVLLAVPALLFWPFAAFDFLRKRTKRRKGGAIFGTPPQASGSTSASTLASMADPPKPPTASAPSQTAKPAAPSSTLPVQLVVMRYAPVSGASYFRVDVDGVRVAVLKANQYTTIALEPGAHRLAVNGRISIASDTVARFDAVAGDAVVYQLEVPFFGRPRLERVMDVKSARRKLARLKPVTPEAALWPASSQPAADPAQRA